MKTALLKTNLWDDDTIFSMNIDTKLLYLILLTSPERGVGRIYKLGKRIQSFRTGLNNEQLDLCHQQLEKMGLVYFYEGYVYLSKKSSFVQPLKGKLTKITYSREVKETPDEVISYFSSVSKDFSPESHRRTTGDSPEHVNDNVHDGVNVKVNDKIKKRELDPEAIRLSTLLQSKIRENYPFVKQKSREVERWAVDIEKVNRIDGYDWPMVEAVILWSQKNDFWQKNIRSGIKLREKFETLLVQIKSDITPKRRKVTVG